MHEAWLGRLRLSFARAGGKTVVAERAHHGPLCLQRPFYPGDGACHVYLLHPPGGLTRGDRLLLEASAGEGTGVLLTTPASTKFYGSPDCSTVEQHLVVASGASLEWLPLETILFGGSRARIVTRVVLQNDARFIGWEVSALGRPLSGDHYRGGALQQRTEIRLGDRPLLVERLGWRDAGAAPQLTAPWGLGGFSVWGALYAWPAGGAELRAARSVIAECGREAEAAATLLDGLLVVRLLSPHVEDAHGLLESVWAALRPDVVGRAPCAPRVWRT